MEWSIVLPTCLCNAAQALDAMAKLQANLKQEQVLQSEMSIEVYERVRLQVHFPCEALPFSRCCLFHCIPGVLTAMAMVGQPD